MKFHYNALGKEITLQFMGRGKNKTVLPLEDDSNGDENKNVIPRKIWMMWDQGLDNAPLSVKQCHESWVKKNPDHTVQMLTLKEGEELVGK